MLAIPAVDRTAPSQSMRPSAGSLEVGTMKAPTARAPMAWGFEMGQSWTNVLPPSVLFHTPPLAAAAYTVFVEAGSGTTSMTYDAHGDVLTIQQRSGSAYTASKHGVIGLARAVAQDAGPFGVTSNAVLPGWVRTAMAERSAKTEAERRGISVEQVWRERAAIYPQNRVLEPREVAQVIAFLCSDAAGGVNGEAITVALGGMW